MAASEDDVPLFCPCGRVLKKVERGSAGLVFVWRCPGCGLPPNECRQCPHLPRDEPGFLERFGR